MPWLPSTFHLGDHCLCPVCHCVLAGFSCHELQRTKSCGAYNGGCQQTCNNGVCSCSAGYTLNADRKTCKARSCGTPTLTSYCPAGAQCVKPTYSCTGSSIEPIQVKYLHGL